MNVNEHTTPEKLERYAFLWSLARMVIAAVSLFFGAMPIAYKLGGYSFAGTLLPLFWLISGAASIYLLYLWFQAGKKVFGGSDKNGTIAFYIMVITGLNLGYAAIGNNIGMSLIWGMPIADLLFKATALIYLVVAYMMWKSWKANGEHLFAGSTTEPNTPPASTE